jgi:hypothetical protein
VGSVNSAVATTAQRRRRILPGVLLIIVVVIPTGGVGVVSFCFALLSLRLVARAFRVVGHFFETCDPFHSQFQSGKLPLHHIFYFSWRNTAKKEHKRRLGCEKGKAREGQQ